MLSLRRERALRGDDLVDNGAQVLRLLQQASGVVNPSAVAQGSAAAPPVAPPAPQQQSQRQRNRSEREAVWGACRNAAAPRKPKHGAPASHRTASRGRRSCPPVAGVS